MTKSRTSNSSCRNKNRYVSEISALRALNRVQETRRQQGIVSECRVYPCSARGAEHWHLTSRTLKMQGETGRYIAMLERTIAFLLREIERRGQ